MTVPSPIGEDSPQGRVVVASTATAVPPHILSRETVKRYIGPTFSLAGRRLSAILDVVDNSRIDRRYAILPVDELIEPRPLDETSRLYREHALKLGRCVAQRALDNAGLLPSDVDMIVTVSCTGFLIPSLDAYLANEMGFRSDLRRLPITELGCAAGAVGLSRAWEHIRAFPNSTVLLISVELPSLTLQRSDVSQANLISAILFGDGAAAAVVTGRPAEGPMILESRSHLFTDSLEAMGFDLRNRGFHIVLSKDVPDLVRDKIAALFENFLRHHSLSLSDVKAFILHPGGQKLLGHIEQELALCACQVQPSWDVLRDYGNLSSATVLFVLHEWLNRKQMAPGERGLLAAFGPGFSAEMLLLQWT